MNSFIKKLIAEEKLRLTEPSDEIAASYLLKSAKSLLSSKKLLEIENYDDATALTYYSMYYAVLALFYKCGIKSENHAGTIILLKEIFGINNTGMAKAKKERVDKQYYVDFKATKKEVDDGVNTAEEFNSKIRETIERLSKQQMKKYQEKIQEYF
ncbi:MAG: HEPN domain-containing protein [archaeon]